MKKLFKRIKRSKEKKELSPEEGKIRYPRENELEMFGVVVQRMGSNQLKVQCNDGQERSVRIPGKLKKKVWVREGDLVIIRLWDFQPSKADLVWRFQGYQIERIKSTGLISKLPI